MSMRMGGVRALMSALNCGGGRYKAGISILICVDILEYVHRCTVPYIHVAWLRHNINYFYRISKYMYLGGKTGTIRPYGAGFVTTLSLCADSPGLKPLSDFRHDEKTADYIPVL